MFEFPNQKGALPKVNISWHEANSLCSKYNKTLCPTIIWEQECNTMILPPELCNINGTALVPSGKGKCFTPKKISDLLGNAWEWTADDLTVPELQPNPTTSMKEIRGDHFF